MLHRTGIRNWTWAYAAPMLFALSFNPTLQAQKTAIERAPVTEISTDHGPAGMQQPMNLTVHLQMHNKEGFDKAVEALYTAGSPTYHQWMTEKDLAAYAPTPQEVETVQKELEAHGLSTVVSSDHFYLRARGTVSNVEEAFHTRIHNYERDGRIFQANAAPAQLAGPAAELVYGVTGLSTFPLQPHLSRQVNQNGQPLSAPIPVQTVQSRGGLASLMTSQCFMPSQKLSFQTQGATLPIASYMSNIYVDKSAWSPAGPSCDWTPSQIQLHYSLPPAYQEGLNGSGQTIIFLEEPTDGVQLVTDLQSFSQLGGLPFSASNVQVFYPDGQPLPAAIANNNVGEEPAIDVDWAHTIAPNAKLVVLIAPSNDWDEFTICLNYAREQKLGNVISISYGLPEYMWGPSVLDSFDQAMELAAAAGIAVNVSSGDSGDEKVAAPGNSGAEYPASSVYATAVGGTSIGLPNGTGYGAEVGWGINTSGWISAATGGANPNDPPSQAAFRFGSGGGVSYYFSKPSWQSSLSGSQRQIPDIAMLADPFTGVPIVFNGNLEMGWGGTSLATPIFSGFWALSDEKAGKSLGQASRIMETMAQTLTGGVYPITDIVPFTSSTNPTGTVTDSQGTTSYTTNGLVGPETDNPPYFAALWNDNGAGEYQTISFGTDTSLTVAKGWDNVTGWGVPRGLYFIAAAAAMGDK